MQRPILFLAACLLAGIPRAVSAGPAPDGVADLGSYATRVEIHPFESLTLTDRQFLTGTSEGRSRSRSRGSCASPRRGRSACRP